MISFIGFVINLSLNMIFIPKVLNGGAVIAAGVAALTQLFVALAQAIYCKRNFELALIDKSLLRYLVLVAVLSFWYISAWFSPIGNLNSTWLIFCDILYSLLLLFVLKFIDIKELISLVQKRSKTQ
jgi:peptidoglycan biosynthesis protein MviN/MurJ (putative lipid II flippase)